MTLSLPHSPVGAQIPPTIPRPAAYTKRLRDAGFDALAETYEHLLRFAVAVRSAGGQAYLVGGCVRDMLRGELSKDYDVEVHGLSLDRLEGIAMSLAESVNNVGKSYGVLKLSFGTGIETDVSVPRRDSKVGAGHTGIKAEPDPSLSLEEAVRRRDFTINALLADPETGEVIDLVGGRADLENGILRVVDPATFAEDPLRTVRALQFLARFDLILDPASAPVLQATLPHLRELSGERFLEEWKKLLLRSAAPSVGLRAGMELGVFPVLHPEIAALAETPQDPGKHPEGNVFVHTCMVVDAAAAIARREKLDADDAWTLLLAALCHDFGKPATTQEVDGRLRCLGHEQEGVAPARTFLGTIRASGDTTANVLSLVRAHLAPNQLYREYRKDLESGGGDPGKFDGAIRRLAKRVSPASIRMLLLVSEADIRGRGPFPQDAPPRIDFFQSSWLQERSAALAVFETTPKNLLEGKDLLALGFPAGKALGTMIQLANDLRDEQQLDREAVVRLLEGTADPREGIARLEAMRQLGEQG